jgi:hypothetical protein
MKEPRDYENGLPRTLHSEWTTAGVPQSSTSPLRWDKLPLEDCDCTEGATDALAAFYENGPARPVYIECVNCRTGYVEEGDSFEVWYEEVEEPWVRS